MSQAPPPTFLIGAQRSGSTLLRVMLDHHPEICFPRLRGIGIAMQFVGPDRRVPESARDYLKAFNSSFTAVREGFEVDPTLPLPRLLESFLEQSRRRSGKRFVMATVHEDFERLPTVWPRARYVYLLRDGRDVARSGAALGWSGNYWVGVEPWIRAEEEWARMRAGLKSDQFLEVRYEDLVNAPVLQLERICEFVGTRYDPAIFDYVEATEFGRPDPSLVEQWRRKMTDAELNLAEARIGELLERRGYERSGLPTPTITPRQAGYYVRHDRWVRRRHRIRRIGLTLFFLDFMTRRLRSVNRWVRHRIDRRLHADS